MAAEIISTVFNSIRRRISYLFNYQSHVENLKSLVKELEYRREMVEQHVDRARRQGDEIFEDVTLWLVKVEKFTVMVEKSIIEFEDEERNRCFKGLCPNLVKRYSIGKKAVLGAKEGSRLNIIRELSNVSYRSVPAPERNLSLYVREYELFDSRMTIFKNIMEALMDYNIIMIGVHGMAGVGKTTLVKNVARKAIEDKLVDEVVMVEVTLTPDLQDIQEKIACHLGILFGPGPHLAPFERANRIRCRLKGMKRVLVVLDNIWAKLDLEAIGIPFSGDGQSQCKILLTSRSERVCIDMNSQSIFHIGFLSDEEAMDLFWKNAGNFSKETFDYQPLALEIVKNCEGLPIAITTIARALKNKHLFHWRDAYNHLRQKIPSMDTNVDSAINLSYEYLGNMEAKSLFLLCGLINDGSQIFIDDLMRYGVGLGLFEQVYGLEATRNKVLSLIDNLKDSCLLLDGDVKDHVKMHIIVHNAAVSIASNELMFSIQGVADLKEELENEIHKDAKAICIPFGDIYEFPERLDRPKLKLFLLFAKNPSLLISDPFFERLTDLRVLGLTRILFPSLPSSLRWLINLRTLTLQSCVLGDVAIIGELRKLEILSFQHSEIEQLPEEIGHLTRLKLLDLSNCLKLEVIHANVISHLSRLEELYMGNSFTKWEAAGQSNASLAELNCLSRLTTLDIHIPDLQVIPQDLFSVEIERYRIFMGDVWSWSDKYETSRTLKLKLNKSDIFFKLKLNKDWLIKLLKRTEDLYLDELTGFKNVVPDLDDEERLPRLKHLHVQNGPEILYIVDSDGWSAFSLLESLFLQELIKLEKICHGLTIDDQSFSKLRIINVERCHSLKHLFSFSMVKNLLQLEEIKLTDCENIKTIFDKEGSENHVLHENERFINFNVLHSLTLQNLPQFASSGFNLEKPTTTSSSKEIVAEDDLKDFSTLFNNKVIFPSLEKLILSSINIERIWLDQFAGTSYSQNLTVLKVKSCNRLKFLFPSSVGYSIGRLRTLVIRGCESMEEVINMRFERVEPMTRMDFSSLLYLKLEGLPKLTRFSIGNSIDFPSLRKLRISNCPNLERFISSSICAEEMTSQENIHTADVKPLFDEKGISHAPKLQRGQLTEAADDGGQLEGDLNTTKQLLFKQWYVFTDSPIFLI